MYHLKKLSHTTFLLNQRKHNVNFFQFPSWRYFVTQLTEGGGYPPPTPQILAHRPDRNKIPAVVGCIVFFNALLFSYNG
jgi:hypothetical protein